MRINSFKNNSVSFCYDKYLNHEVITRLNQNPDLAINRSILKMNETCNFIEDEIDFLSNNNGQRSENYKQINILLGQFFPLKLMFTELIERFFPDLNYADREADNYEAEFMDTEIDFDIINDDEIEKVYKWKEVISEAIITHSEEKRKLQNIDGIDKYFIDEKDFKKAIKTTYTDEGNIENLIEKFQPNEYSPTSLFDVCGLDKTKEKLERSIIEPLENPKIAKQRKEDYGIDIPRFVLLYGPPGCGKTMLTQAIAQETGCDMYMLDVSKIGSSYINESAKNIGTIFDYIKEKAQNSQKPIILFMDEMDSLMSKRSGGSNADIESNKVVNTLLTQINELKNSNIIVFGATNMPDLIDSAGKNRANVSHYIGLPNEKEIVKLLKNNLSKYTMTKRISENTEDLAEIAKTLKGYSPRTIVNILADAKEIAYENEKELSKEDIKQAINSSDFEKIKEQDYIPNEKKKIGF